MTDQPVTDQPVTDEPVTDQPLTGQPLTGRPLIARLRDVCVDANDAELVGGFWAAVLGRQPEVDEQGDVLLRPAADGGPGLWVNRVPEPKTVKNRIHLDVDLEPGQEVTDLLRLGASVVTAPGEAPWWVLADPEGNEFCAFPPEADATNDADAELPVP